MIDLHTHLLPDWDNGAKDLSETLQMCEIACDEGITDVVLTPHVFRLNKYRDDLKILEKRKSEFKEKTSSFPLHFYMGAEVFVHSSLMNKIKANDFSINNSNYIYLEFPSDYIIPNTNDLVCKLLNANLIPIICHPEKNSIFMERPQFLYELITMGCLAQVASYNLTGASGHKIRKTARFFIRKNLVHFIASDAHDAYKRPPFLERAVEAAGKITTREKAEAMVTEIPSAILKNTAVPNYGDPEHPEKKIFFWK